MSRKENDETLNYRFYRKRFFSSSCAVNWTWMTSEQLLFAAVTIQTTTFDTGEEVKTSRFSVRFCPFKAFKWHYNLWYNREKKHSHRHQLLICSQDSSGLTCSLSHGAGSLPQLCPSRKRVSIQSNLPFCSSVMEPAACRLMWISLFYKWTDGVYRKVGNTLWYAERLITKTIPDDIVEGSGSVQCFICCNRANGGSFQLVSGRG